MGYREKWFKANPGVHRFGHRGLWWRCVRCHGWFQKKDIDIDHRVPKRLGGTDDLCNLQPMCYHCNRSKNDNMTAGDFMGTLVRSAVSGKAGSMAKGMLKQKAKDAFGIKYKR